jgi:hypothetical protein
MLADTTLPDPMTSIQVEPVRLRPLLIYVGYERPVTADRATLIARWAQSMRVGSAVARLFQREFLFREDTLDFWLPVQAPVASHFARELRPGDTIVAFVGLLGGLKRGNAVDWVFVMNEFEARPRN